MKLSREEIEKFQKEILEWYEKNQRPLPWRDAPVRTSSSGASLRDPYKILVSEVMSQQTQISRVVPKYLAWIERFPTLESLADAPTSEVLRYWNGLGYNRRALYLQRLARELVKRSPSPQPSPTRGEGDQGQLFPRTEAELKKLPGIGEYTARAILCFAFNKQIAVVDTNVRKVILVRFKNVIPDLIRDPDIDSRFRGNDKEVKAIKLIAERLLPQGKAYTWNQALMDYAGAMLKEHKIPVPRQSHFKTSNRFYRGQVIRMLLKGPETVDSAFEKLENNGITKEKFEEIIKQMEKDGLVCLEEQNMVLP